MGRNRAYRMIDDDSVIMNNGDRMVDASTAYLAIDLALSGWEPLSKPVPAVGAVDVLFAEGVVREVACDRVCEWIYPQVESGYAVAWRLRDDGTIHSEVTDVG